MTKVAKQPKALSVIPRLRCSKEECHRMLACLCLIIFSIVFGVLYQQTPMSVNVFTGRNLDHHLVGFTLPTVMYQHLNFFFITICTPLMTWFWTRTNGCQFVFPTALTFAVATVLMGLEFLVLP